MTASNRLRLYRRFRETFRLRERALETAMKLMEHARPAAAFLHAETARRLNRRVNALGRALAQGE